MAMKKGTVKRWLKAEGEEVVQGAPLCEIMTEKITAVVPAPASGILGRIVADPRVLLPVGALLALVGDLQDRFPAREELADAAVPVSAAPRHAAAASIASAETALTTGNGGAMASPAARRVARELGIDITLVPPSAPGKRISTEDVEAFAAARAAGPAGEGQVRPFGEIRRVIAERLTGSLQTMAQVTVTREVDATGLVARRNALAAGFEAATGLRLSYTDLLIEIVARLLLESPLLNATLTDEGIAVPDAVHMGFAVALDDGLIVPVIRNANTRSLAEIARDRVVLAAKAEAGTLTLEEIEGGTFTISNLGSFGADAFTPIVNPPQCAILGVGRIAEKPVVVDGAVQVRPTMWLSLTFDHRIVDGAPAARFLQALGERLT